MVAVYVYGREPHAAQVGNMGLGQQRRKGVIHAAAHAETFAEQSWLRGRRLTGFWLQRPRRRPELACRTGRHCRRCRWSFRDGLRTLGHSEPARSRGQPARRLQRM